MFDRTGEDAALARGATARGVDDTGTLCFCGDFYLKRLVVEATIYRELRIGNDAKDGSLLVASGVGVLKRARDSSSPGKRP